MLNEACMHILNSTRTVSIHAARIPLQKLQVAQFVNKFPDFYATRPFTAVFTRQPATKLSLAR